MTCQKEVGDTFGSLDQATDTSQPSQLAYGLLLAFAHPKQKLVSDTGVELLWWWSAGCVKAHNVLWKQTKRGPGGYLGFKLEMKKLLQQSCLQLH